MTKTPNVHLKHVISELKKESAKHESSIWKRVAEDLERPTRIRRVVNVSKLARVTNANETIVIPGKVLGSGMLTHSVTVAAWDFSASARKVIEDAKGKCITILDLQKKEPKGKNVRIIG